MARNKSNRNNTTATLSRSTSNKKRPVSTGYGGNAPAAVVTRGINSGPSIAGGPRGQSRFSHTEYVSDVLAPALNTNAPGYAFPLNPSSGFTFPWLSKISVGFEVYRFRKLRLTYTPSCSSATAGLVVGGFDYDAADPPPTTKQQLSGYEGAGRVNVWAKTSWDMVCPNGWYYCNPNGVTSGDGRLTDVARFFLGVYAHATASATIGEITVSYDVEFAKPEIASLSTTMSAKVEITGSTYNDLEGSSVSIQGDQILEPQHSPNSGQLKLLIKVGGSFLVNLISLATSSTAPVAGNVFASIQVDRGNGFEAVPWLEYYNAFVSSGASYLATNLFTFNGKAGDILMLTAATSLTALQIQRMRITPYRITNA